MEYGGPGGWYGASVLFSISSTTGENAEQKKQDGHSVKDTKEVRVERKDVHRYGDKRRKEKRKGKKRGKIKSGEKKGQKINNNNC